MAAANKPVWVQVAEAGFGDRLAELGWKQVSPAHWRLDGDGVIWRTMLGPARKDILKDKLYEEARPNRPDYSKLDRMMATCWPPRPCRRVRRHRGRAPCARISAFSSGGLLQRFRPYILYLFD